MSDILLELNNEQLMPVKDTEGAVLVFAGAGSGKTRVLTSRIAYLIEEKRVSPSNILAITFTNKAANEMKERIEGLVSFAGGMWVSTIHSMCVKILRANIGRLNYTQNFTIYDETDREKALKRVLADRGIQDEKNQILKNLKFHLSNAKNQFLTPAEYQRENITLKDINSICELMEAYENYMFSSNALDFDDILVKCYELLIKNEDVKEYYTEKFKYVHVDEFQDTNKIQFLIIKLLASKHGNLFVVGDDDQSIYGWRGADIQNILGFEKKFGKVKVYKLEQNYRSTKKILSLANAIISKNKMRKTKTLWTDNDEGARIERYIAQDEMDEASYASMQIKSLVQKGYKYSDFAILMRVNALSRVYEQEFLKYAIPYKVYGGFKFYERKEIKDVLAYLKLINNPRDNESFYRIVNYPKRGIGDKSLESLRHFAIDNGLADYEALFLVDNIGFNSGTKAKFIKFRDLMEELREKSKTLNVIEIFDLVINSTKIKEDFAEKTEENYNKLLNIDELRHSIIEFDRENGGVSLSDYLTSVTLSTDIDSINEGDAVTVATIHAVKGLEYKTVFVVGLDEGIFPVSRAQDDLDELEEERRLMYVAVTRAEERLYLTMANSRYLYGDRSFTRESRFLREATSVLYPEREKQLERKNEERIYKSDDLGFSSKNGSGYSSSHVTSLFNQKKPEPNKNTDFGGYRSGAIVAHAKFGEGTIIQVKGNGTQMVVDVAFKGIGIKSLAVAFAPIKLK